MVWPTRAAPNPNGFLDHFPGSSLDSTRWGSVVSGTGAVSVTDSYAQMSAPANSAAFIYHKAKIDKTKSQLWLVCINRYAAGAAGNPGVWVVNGASDPAADTQTNINAKTLISGGPGNQSSLAWLDWYYSSAGTQTYWSGTTGGTPNIWTSTWATSLSSMMPIRNDDFYIIGIEIDGVNSRWRLLGFCKTYTSGYTFDQGWRLFSISDWVTWANTRSNADIWLCLGQMYTNVTSEQSFRVEWVRYCESVGNGIIDAWASAKAPGLGGHPHIRHFWSYDGKVFVPEDRGTDALSITGAGWESYDLQCPQVVRDGSTDYLFYYGQDSTGNTAGLGVATAVAGAANAPQNGAWTRFGSNPIIQAGGGERRPRYPFFFKDDTDSDPDRRWKCVVPFERSADNIEEIHLVTAPAATGPWTRRGLLIAPGGSGASDEGGCWGIAGVVYVSNRWEVWYTGMNPAGTIAKLLMAHGPKLDGTTLTKSGVDHYSESSITQTLTANLTGKTVTVADTSGFTVDAMVLLAQTNNFDNVGCSRVRKILSSTQLELYHALDGFTSAASCRIRQVNGTRTFGGQVIVKVGSEWWFYMTQWGAFMDLSPTINGLIEQNMLLTHSGATPSAATPVYDFLASPITPRGFNDDLRSVENMGLALTPVTPDRIGPDYSGFPIQKIADLGV